MPIIQDLSKYTTSDYVAKYVSEALSSSLSSGYYRYLPTQAFTLSGTWSPQVDGTYMIICVGKGGDGVSNSGSRYRGNAGSGGGGGGVGIYIGDFKAGDSYPITITNTSVCFNTDWIIANSGGNGTVLSYNDTDTMETPGGKGGTVTGSHVTAMYNGESGETKTSYAYDSVEPGGRGGSAGCVLSIPGVNGSAGIGCLPGAYVDGTGGSVVGTYKAFTVSGGSGGMYGAGASGGGGAHVSLISNGGTLGNATGGKGGNAIVLIQILGTK